MTLRPALLAPAALLALAAVPAAAVPGGEIGTLAQGPWTCETPGDALALPVPLPALSFRIVPDSSYLAPDGTRGTYLLLGDVLRMTSGPFDGRTLRVETPTRAVPIETAQSSAPRLRCVRGGPVRLPVRAAPGDLR